MSDNTKIEWADSTWNVITGCSVVSAGCRHCYAMKLAGTRLQHHPSRAGLTIDTAAGPVWNGQVRFNEQWLTQPLAWKRPRKVFVCAHGDLFHEAVPDAWIDAVFSVMIRSPQHVFQVLTKRPARMLKFCTERGYRLPNVWMGVSVEDQAAADERVPLLLETPAAIRWISAEPLLGPVRLDDIQFKPRNFINALDLEEWRGAEDSPEVQASPGKGALIDWVVVGGESGANARPMHPAWARSLRDQCASAGVPFLFKQWGEWLPACHYYYYDDSARDDALDVQYRLMTAEGTAWVEDFDGQPPIGTWIMHRVGKKAAGRLLDGVLHDGYPEARP